MAAGHGAAGAVTKGRRHAECFRRPLEGSSRADLLTTPFDSGRGRVLWRLIHRAGIVEQYLFSPSHAGAGFGDAVAFSGVQGVDPSPPVRTSFLGHEGHWGEDVA